MHHASQQPDIISRRRVPRRIYAAPVGVLVAGGYAVGRGYQVGEGGMMISTDQQSLTEDLQIVVSFYLPSGEMIVVRAVVRSVIAEAKGSAEKYGLEFLNLDFQSKRAIRNFVAAATRVDGHIVL